MSCLTNGAVGGDSGWEAALVSFRFAVETPPALEDGEKMKIRKPIVSKPARTNVMELVRRNGLGKAMMVGIDGAKISREIFQKPQLRISGRLTAFKSTPSLSS